MSTVPSSEELQEHKDQRRPNPFIYWVDGYREELLDNMEDKTIVLMKAEPTSM